MKSVLAQSGVETAKWACFDGNEGNFFAEIAENVGFPCILKPDISAGSFGIVQASRVNCAAALAPQFAQVRAGKSECLELTSGWFAESFVEGREFTVLVSGNAAVPESILVYTPLEYSFSPHLSPDARFLHYSLRYELDAAPGQPDRYQYRIPEPPVQASLRHTARAAYLALGGHGYARVDMRQDQASGTAYVLEVNANCGLGCDPSISTMGTILSYDQEPYAAFIHRLIGLGCLPG
jgi:D-alanine-D-alanine ligase